MQTLEERVAGLKTIGILLIVPLTAIAVSCGSRTEEQPDISSANRLFLAGEFAEAQKVYAALAARDPKDYSPAVQLGHIALLGNRLEEAQDWLQKALADKPGDVDAKIMLAEVYYRRNDAQWVGREQQQFVFDSRRQNGQLGHQSQDRPARTPSPAEIFALSGPRYRSP